MGPTAVGKSGLAIKLCQKLPFDIVSVDSAMVYRGMDIGTAKPSPEILAKTPHRLIDICDPAESYSAAQFRIDALKEIESIHSKNRIPLLVGGTGLYFRTLEMGISELPSADNQVRSQIEEDAVKMGWQAMHQHLAEVDPHTAAKIHPNDPQRIQRALEVFELTGKPMSELYALGTAKPLLSQVIKVILSPQNRNVIHERVKERFIQMLDCGLIDEVRGFYGRGDLDSSMPSMRMVGYRQVWRYLAGLLDYQDMIDHAIVATRQLAKRQLTWLRKEQNARWFDTEQSLVLDNVLRFLDENRNLSVRI